MVDRFAGDAGPALTSHDPVPSHDRHPWPTEATVSVTTLNRQKGVFEMKISSPYAVGDNVMQVLLPEGYSGDRQWPILVTLPVYGGPQEQNSILGDGLAEVRELGWQDTWGVIVVQPTLQTESWFGSHETDTQKRHDLYVTEVVLPIVEWLFGACREPSGRMLVGFSKTGFGALSLLTRHPEIFGFASSWDSPLLMDSATYGEYNMAYFFGSPAQLDTYAPLHTLDYAIPSLSSYARIAIAGSYYFGTSPSAKFVNNPHTEGYHALLAAAGVPHEYNPNLQVDHSWHGGWLPWSLGALVRMKASADGLEPPSDPGCRLRDVAIGGGRTTTTVDAGR